MSRTQSPQRARMARLVGAVGAGVLVVGMITVGSAVAADSSGSTSVDLKAPQRSKEAVPVHKVPAVMRSKEG